jgi:hypothetical protein
VIYIPLGQYKAPSAWRKSLTGVLGGPATPVFWNIEKTEYARRRSGRRIDRFFADAIAVCARQIAMALHGRAPAGKA